jgi:hypothetical protein
MIKVDLEQRLALIKDVKRFCVEDLEMIGNDSFNRVVQKEYPCYALFVSKKYSIESIFFDNEIQFKSKSLCQLGAKAFNSLGFDVVIGKITALVDDLGSYTGETTQVTQSLLRDSEEDLVQTVLHENFHIHLIKNNPSHYVDDDIEEPIANYFAYQGALKYYQDNPEKRKQIVETKKAVDKYNIWYNTYFKMLKYNYHTNCEHGREMLVQAKDDYVKLTGNKSTDINNAYFLRFRAYTKNFKAVENILRNKDPKEYLKKIAQTEEISTIKELYHAVNP